MCGGIGFGFKRIPFAQLKEFYSDKEISDFKKNNLVTSFFWQKMPILPYKDQGGQTKLSLWGNRDQDLKIPKTGWAKIESYNQGKWDYLKPQTVKILAEKGYEKGVWFETKNGISGLKIEYKNKPYIYMLTKPSSKEYFKLTQHDREPVLQN